MAILMFRTIANPDINNTDQTTIGNALSQLQKTHAGKAALFILGFFLIIYGTFAVGLLMYLLVGTDNFAVAHRLCNESNTDTFMLFAMRLRHMRCELILSKKG